MANDLEETSTMDESGRILCLPVVMIVNYALFQYLLTLYFARRSEPRILLLLACAFLGFAAMVPLAHPEHHIVGHLNDISETCSTLTFLIQITIQGRDVHRKVRIWSLWLMTLAAELLVVFGLLVVVLNLVDVFDLGGADLTKFDGFDNIMENAGLFFIFFFRFYYMVMARGFKWVLRERKFELLLYLLFVTHEFPFLAIEEATGESWEPVQAIWNRLTIMMCVLQTIRDKIQSSKTTQASHNVTSKFSKAPAADLDPGVKPTAQTRLGTLVHPLTKPGSRNKDMAASGPSSPHRPSQSERSVHD